MLPWPVRAATAWSTTGAAGNAMATPGARGTRRTTAGTVVPITRLPANAKRPSLLLSRKATYSTQRQGRISATLYVLAALPTTKPLTYAKGRSPLTNVRQAIPPRPPLLDGRPLNPPGPQLSYTVKTAHIA